MKLNQLRPARGATRNPKKVGRGPGSGHGKTSTRGHKGQGQHHTGRRIKRAHEGGQNPLLRRIPKRGFTSRNRIDVQEVNLQDLARFAAGATVDRESLHKAKAISSLNRPVKILGKGKISVALKLKVDRISEAARKAVEAAGGSVELAAAQAAAKA